MSLAVGTEVPGATSLLNGARVDDADFPPVGPSRVEAWRALVYRLATLDDADNERASRDAARDALAASDAAASARVAAIAGTGQMQDLITVGPDRPALLSTDALL